jgi:hypothetical protein
MGPTPDPKRNPGNRVHARSHHVLGERAARNRFGALWKQSWVGGTVESVTTSKVGVREQASIFVTWDVGETKVRKALISINVRARDPAASETLSRGEIGPEERHELVPNVEDEGDRRRTPNHTVSTSSCRPHQFFIVQTSHLMSTAMNGIDRKTFHQ